MLPTCIQYSQKLGIVPVTLQCENCLLSIAVLTACVFTVTVQQKINILLYAKCVVCKQICVTVLSTVST